jgi:hypothetical protein
VNFDRISKNTQIPNFMKIGPVGAELFHAGGRTDEQTDMTKLIVAFRNFANAPENCYQPQEHKQNAVTFSEFENEQFWVSGTT